MKAKEPCQLLKEALSILSLLGFPSALQNERSAWTLLSLLDLTPGKSWQEATNPMMGITPIMDWMREHYGKRYAPNTREIIRRRTIHQFVAAGIVIPNPDDPQRPINSPKTVYQIEEPALKIFRLYRTPLWQKKFARWLARQESLSEKYAMRREKEKVPVRFYGKKLFLSPGKHSELIRDVIEQFGALYVPNGVLVYVGDTEEKWKYFDSSLLSKLGVHVDSHGKMPDVILFSEKNNWLFLIEAVTSHGPVDGKRHLELSKIFANAKAGLVYVTAFPDRFLMGKHLGKIAWETEVWVADSSSHLIHFDGERFLGPYVD